MGCSAVALSGESTLAQATVATDGRAGTCDHPVMVDPRREAFARYIGVWNGEKDLSVLESLVTPGFVGHLGSQDRDLARLKQDIEAYRRGAPDVRFTVEHQFAAGDWLATRLTAEATGAGGAANAVVGINLSRWYGPLLAEEWAVWEPLVPSVDGGAAELRRLARVADVAPAVGPYSHAVVAGGTVYVAGQVATDADGNLVGEGDFTAQARQVYRNLDAVLRAAGTALDRVLKLTVFLTDIENVAVAARVRAEFMSAHAYPASTVVQVTCLPDPRWLIEVEAIAYV